MKKWILVIVALSIFILVTGCGTKENDNKESDESTMNKPTNQAETPNAVKDEITISELKIKNGENTIYGKIYVPSGEGKHPAVILSHGYNGTNNDFVNECKYYAQNGYITYAFDFCGGSVNSKSTGKSTDMTIFTEKSDLLAVFDYISKMDTVDSEQIFLFGGSQGGLVTTLATEEIADNVKGMILYFPALCI